jgi:four helix bundle protein
MDDSSNRKAREINQSHKSGAIPAGDKPVIRLNDFRDLDVWKHCHEIRQKIREICKGFPNEERYRLTDQMIRASRSPTANIAEGYGRYHFQENIQFCRQARGSLYELIDHVTAALECEYLTHEEAEKMVGQAKRSSKHLSAHCRLDTPRNFVY